MKVPLYHCGSRASLLRSLNLKCKLYRRFSGCPEVAHTANLNNNILYHILECLMLQTVHCKLCRRYYCDCPSSHGYSCQETEPGSGMPKCLINRLPSLFLTVIAIHSSARISFLRFPENCWNLLHYLHPHRTSIISSRKTPGFAGGLTEFDLSGNTCADVCIRRSKNGLSSWRRLLNDAHLSVGLDILNSFDYGQAPLRGQQS
jgi:hypothetical protein